MSSITSSILFLLTFVRAAYLERDSHFADPLSGRISWVIDENSLPWTGAYHFLGSLSSEPTVLLTVVDSSSGNHLGECTAHTEANEWHRFFWTLSEDALLCNVSGSVISRVRFPPSEHPRTFSIRILAGRGPRCFRDMIVQNERPKGCPPQLRRNSYQQSSLECECAEDSEPDEHHTEAPPSIAFPIFELTATSEETSQEESEPSANAFGVQTHLPPNESGALAGANNRTRVHPQPVSVNTGGDGPEGPEHGRPDRGHTEHFLPVTHPPTTVTTTHHLVEPHPCTDFECFNNGTCVLNSLNEAMCVCPEGFSGPLCELSVCSTMPCMNGGVCRQIGTEAHCDCPAGFTGVLCEQVLCEPECQNGGACVLSNHTGVCHCRDGTIGINCNVIDVCADNMTCSVFGPQALCQIDAESFMLVPSTPVNASYQCQCLDENNHWADCLELAVKAASLSPAAITPKAATTPAAVVEPAALVTTPSPPPISVHHSTATSSIVHPFPAHTFIGVVENSTASTATDTEEHLTENEVLFPIIHRSSLLPTPIPHFTENPDSEESGIFQNRTVMFPISSLPSTENPFPEASTEISSNGGDFEMATAETTIQVEETYETTALPEQSPSGSGDVLRPVQTLHSLGKGNNMTSENVSIIPPFGVAFPEMTPEQPFVVSTAPPPHHHIEVTAGVDEHTTLWPHQMTTMNVLPTEHATTTPPLHQTWTEAATTPSVDVVMPNFFASATTTPAPTTEEETAEPPVQEEETDEVPTLNPWTEHEVSTTEEEVMPEGNLSGEWPSVDHTHGVEQFTEPPFVHGHVSSATEFETTEIPVHVNNVETTTESMDARGGHEKRVNMGEKEASEGSSKASSASWIVALVAVIILLMLVGAAGLFVLRYVQRSRKLHGKYNPAREENALSSSYSMPMTTVTKEERLI